MVNELEPNGEPDLGPFPTYLCPMAISEMSLRQRDWIVCKINYRQAKPKALARRFNVSARELSKMATRVRSGIPLDERRGSPRRITQSRLEELAAELMEAGPIGSRALYRKLTEAAMTTYEERTAELTPTEITVPEERTKLSYRSKQRYAMALREFLPRECESTFLAFKLQ
jgi:hypothetical protein